MEVSLTSNEKKKISFTCCDVFETDGLNMQNFEMIDTRSRYRVYDWFEATSLTGNFPEERVSRNEYFVKTIWFCGTNKVVCLSELQPDQIYNVEYSDSYSRFTLINSLKVFGYTGKKNGVGKDGKQKYLNLDLTLMKRETFLDTDDTYLRTEKVNFHDSSW